MANYFYTDANGQKQGPINDQLLQSLATQGVIKPQTPLETDTGHKGIAGQIPGLTFAAPTPPSPFTAVPQATSLTPSTTNAATIERLKSYFTKYWICMVVGLPLCIIVIGLPVLIVAIVFMFMLLYQLWKLIPTDIARTSPGAAVGLLCIPLFNLYWMFIAIGGLGQDMNKALERRGIAHRVNASLGLILCILTCVGCVDAIAGFCLTFGLASLLGMIVQVFFFKSVKNGAIHLLEQGDQ